MNELEQLQDVDSPTVKAGVNIQTPAPKVPVGTPINIPPPPPEDPYIKIFEEIINRASVNATDLLSSTIKFMEEYVVKMAPGVNNHGIPAADYQLQFFRILKAAIDKTPIEEFNKTWNIVLAFFWRYKEGALSPYHVNRFAENWNNGDRNLIAYQRIVNLCLISADPAERSKVNRRVNVPKTVESGFTPAGMQNILQYYKV